jgi:hypothetical protein
MTTDEMEAVIRALQRDLSELAKRVSTMEVAGLRSALAVRELEEGPAFSGYADDDMG